MLSHTHLGIADLDRALRFYAPLMAELGLVLKFHEPERGWAGWMRPGHPRPLFLVGRPFDGGPPHPGNGTLVALLALDRPDGGSLPRAPRSRRAASTKARPAFGRSIIRPSTALIFGTSTATSSASAATTRWDLDDGRAPRRPPLSPTARSTPSRRRD